MDEASDLKYMLRCIGLASKAEGLTYPNPLVGAVIVHQGRVIGEGYHLKAGGPHAEVIAVNSVSDKSLLGSSVIYVNLEPCSHFGKTPPCADFIISQGIPEVVTGTTDPNPGVAGRGLARLREAGVKVTDGVLADECRHLNRRFFTFHQKKRPYITLKWAESADGFIDTVRTPGQTPGPNWITGKPERALVHKWRSEEEAILVGAATVRADNPRLNVRDWAGRDPLRLVLSRSGVTDQQAAVFGEGAETVIFSKEKGLNNELPSCSQLVDYLYKRGIQSLLVEGGAQVLSHFIEHSLWDEARIFSGLQSFHTGVRAPVLSGKLFTQTDFDLSRLKIWLNQKPGRP